MPTQENQPDSLIPTHQNLCAEPLEGFSEEFGEELIGQLTDELMPEFKVMAEAKYTVVEAAHQSRKPQAGMKA